MPKTEHRLSFAGGVMANSSRTRVGIVGASASRGFASIAHVPALRALPQFEIVAVGTARQETAEAAARHYQVPHAFADARKLARHPDVDLVTVSVKVLDAAERRGIRHAVGLQGQVSPAINYVKDLIAEGYVGRVLTATMIGCAPNWGATIDRAFQADLGNGANLLTITGGHQIDALCHCLGEFRELTAFAVSQRERIPLEATGEMVAKNAPDQLVVNGIVGDGAVVSFQIRGGMTRGIVFLFEIHGEKGDLTLSATSRDSMQRQELTVRGAQGAAEDLAELPVPAKYRWVPDGLPGDSRYNVAQLYAHLAECIREGKPVSPGFAAAVTRHRLLDAIVRSSETGRKLAL